MIFFPEVAFRTDMIPTLAAANTFMCLVCCFLASVAIQLICFDRFVFLFWRFTFIRSSVSAIKFFLMSLSKGVSVVKLGV